MYYYFSHFTDQKTKAIKWHCKNSNTESMFLRKICPDPGIQ